MDAIFHEKQEGALCAQHCLNALLQGSYFTAVDLAAIAQQLDDEERYRMAEGDTNSEEYKTFLAQPSSNMDDSGFFSIQVICNALFVWGLELVPFSNPAVEDARKNPQNQQAFICNLQQHWLTIRKLGKQWFNLNSLRTEPELLTETYLSMFLTQLQTEGYSIFVVVGHLPDCEADQLLKLCPAQPQKKPAPTTSKQKAAHHLIKKSDLAQALGQVKSTGESSSQSRPVDIEDVRRRRENYFASVGRQQNNKEPSTSQTSSQNTSGTSNTNTGMSRPLSEMTEDEMLQAALSLSLSGNT